MLKVHKILKSKKCFQDLRLAAVEGRTVGVTARVVC